MFAQGLWRARSADLTCWPRCSPVIPVKLMQTQRRLPLAGTSTPLRNSFAPRSVFPWQLCRRGRFPRVCPNNTLIPPHTHPPTPPPSDSPKERQLEGISSFRKAPPGFGNVASCDQAGFFPLLSCPFFFVCSIALLSDDENIVLRGRASLSAA